MLLSSWKKTILSRIDLIVLLTCLSVTYAIWNYNVTQDTSSQNSLKDTKLHVEQTVKSESEKLYLALNSVRGLYAASSNVDSKELSDFVVVSTALDDLDALLRIGFIEKVAPTEEIDFIQKIRSRGNTDYVPVKVATDSAGYYVALTVDRFGKLYTPSGRNLLNDPINTALINKIIASNESQFAFVPSVQNIAEYNGPAFIQSLPIYKEGELIGLINGIVSIESIKAQIANLLGEEIAWRWSISDGTVMAEGGVTKGKTISEIAEIPIFKDVNWKIELKKEIVHSPSLNLILGIGVLVSFIFYAMIYGLTSANERGEELANQMTMDLQKYKLALESASNHIIITDADGKILYANKAVEKLTGYSLQEVIGNTPALWGRQMSKEFYLKMWDIIKTKKVVFQGEIVNKRKDGQIYTAQATISPILDHASNNLIGFVGIEENISDRKKKEVELTTMNELMIGREMRMVELKKEIEKLKSGNAKL